jgi:uncharacterized coiled-coil protein SlyX
MSSVSLLHPEETFTIPALQAMNKCSLFQNNPTLLSSPYRIQSSVSLSIFREFLSALEGNAINITNTNLTEFDRLCKEFGFSELSAKLSEFRPSMRFKETESETEDADSRGRIAALEEKVNERDYVIAVLQDKVTELFTDFGRLVSEVSSLRSAAAIIETLSAEVSVLKTQIVEQHSKDLTELRNEISILKTQIVGITPPIQNRPPSSVSVPPSPPPIVPSVSDGLKSDPKLKVKRFGTSLTGKFRIRHSKSGKFLSAGSSSWGL